VVEIKALSEVLVFSSKYFVDFSDSFLGHFLRTFAQLLFAFQQRNINKIDVYVLNTNV
jgi:hypothetical protein